MKTFKTMAAAAMAIIMGSGSALAIDLRNEDEAAHKVTVTSSTMTRDIDMHALTLSFVVCVNECRFTLDGTTVTATKDDVVTIRDGKLSMTPGSAAQR